MSIHGVHIVLGYLLDLAAGDPEWFPHPVRLIGKLIAGLEHLIRKLGLGAAGMKLAGVFLAFITVGVTYGAAWGILRMAWDVSGYLFAALSVLFIYFCLATRCLSVEANKVYQALKEGNLVLARERLSRIVGRDTHDLNEEEITRAAVETVAENTADGIIAPLFYIFIGGPALGLAYKAVSTLDSMVGYMNEEYRDLGWASAKLDDLANWLPARITGVIIILAGGIWGKNSRQAMRIYKRDKGKHKSPNAGHPEAAMAGALGVRLGGSSCYCGLPVVKPTIGDPLKPLEPQDIPEASRIMTTASFLGLVVFYMVSLKFGFQ